MALPPMPRRVRLGLLSPPDTRKVKPGTWLDRSETLRMPCWSSAFWVTAETDRATLLTVEVWRVAVTTTSSMALVLGVAAAWAKAAWARPDTVRAVETSSAARKDEVVMNSPWTLLWGSAPWWETAPDQAWNLSSSAGRKNGAVG